MKQIKLFGIAVLTAVLLSTSVPVQAAATSGTTLTQSEIAAALEQIAMLQSIIVGLQRQLAVKNMTPGNSIVRFETTMGDFDIELYETAMPITTGNFKSLALSDFYDDTKFHRVIDGFMIQGGDPNSKTDDETRYGTGGPGYYIEDEFVSDARLSNRRGTIAMANSGQPNSGGSQFFINTVDNLSLDFDKVPLTSKHPVFGKVVVGMDVVDAIQKTETNVRDIPLAPVVIENIGLVAGK